MDEIDDDVEDIVGKLPKALSPQQEKREKECREIRRLFLELNHVISCLKIAREIQATCYSLRHGFVAIAFRALINDAVSSLIRVLDVHPRSFSFWTINRRFPRTIQMIFRQQKIDSARIRDLADRLMQARRKLHFHIDSDHAANPNELWSRLYIKHGEMFEIANNLATVIASILLEHYSFPANLSKYEAGDVRPILERLHQAGLGNFTKRE